MVQNTKTKAKHSNSYNIFMFVLTIISLVIMVLMFLPLGDATIGLLQVYDNLICVIFLIDFFMNLRERKSTYFIKERGWLDLLGSIPSFGGTFKYSGLLRLARLSRLGRIARLMRGSGKKELVADVVQNRSQYTAFITILLLIIILATTSVLVLQFESQSPDGKILTGGDAFWYSIVTLTTVGYGDFFPVTMGGRITGMFIMFAGVGLIGVLASLLSNLLIGSPSTPEEEATPGPAPATDTEIAALKNELAEMRQLLEKIATGVATK
jgi:voltage-gated potassium channel